MANIAILLSVSPQKYQKLVRYVPIPDHTKQYPLTLCLNLLHTTVFTAFQVVPNAIFPPLVFTVFFSGTGFPGGGLHFSFDNKRVVSRMKSITFISSVNTHAIIALILKLFNPLIKGLLRPHLSLR